MNQMKGYQLLPVVLLTMSFLFSNCKENRLLTMYFHDSSAGEDRDLNGYYVVLNNGEKIEGRKIETGVGLPFKNQIKVDERKFDLSEVKGYRNDWQYFARYKRRLAKRLVYGPKMSIYAFYKSGMNAGGDVITAGVTYLCQRGDSGELMPIKSFEQLKLLVADCPEVARKIDFTNKDMQKILKENYRYLNDVVHSYNRSCN